MAVEARHVNPYPSQFLNDRANMIIGGIHSNNNVQMDFPDLPLPSASSSMADQSPFQFYQSSTLCDPNSAKTSINNNDDSGLTYNNFSSSSRKRSRDEFFTEFNHPRSTKFSSSFLDHDLHLQIQNQQFEIDLLIAQHTEKVRMELEEERRRQVRVLYSAIHGVMMKKLKEKDEEIQKLGKINWALEERVKTLAQENQFLMQLAQTNEATANSLRSKLEHILAAAEAAHVNVDDHRYTAAEAVDDAESSCGSNRNCEVQHRRPERGCERLCRKCGVRESMVLLLPCRHLSLCTMCGSSCHNCPVCHSGINGSVHVNFS